MLGAFVLVAALQGPPATDVYRADLSVRAGRVQVGTAVNLTRRPGYDNQPAFLPDGRLLYTVIADGQADAYRLDPGAAAPVRITATPESEYSPTPLPDGSGFSAVRVEADSTQRLWRFDWNGGSPAVVLPALKPVGYHAWADSHMVALFVLGSPPTLQLADVRSGAVAVVARGIGRGLQRIPGRAAISFVQKNADSTWDLVELDVATGRTRPLVRTLTGVDFHAWTPYGTVLVAQGAKLFQWHPARGPEWEEVADFGPQGLTSITRLAVSPRGDALALVAAERSP